MENCFRFLINVDQCLNMSYFDIFFYKLASQHKFHTSSVQMFGDAAQNSLRGAANDIRMYLDKYPYHVGDYQIIVAMRASYSGPDADWGSSLLCRLLTLDHELRNARILVNSREQTEKALNLIMLYDVDYAANLPELGSYMESGRLQQDCNRLLKLLALSDDHSLDALEQALCAYQASEDHNIVAAELLQDFFRVRRKSYDQISALADHLDPIREEDEGAQQPMLSLELAKFVRDRLCNAQLFEQQVDRNNRRQQTLALLRVVEFINKSTARPEEVLGQSVTMTLAQRCAENWANVWQDTSLEQRYADMLREYQRRLGHAAMELETHSMGAITTSNLPDEDIPKDDAITCEDDIFSDRDPMGQKKNLQGIFRQVLDRNFSLRSISSDWEQAYNACKQLLEKLEYSLESYAGSLSRKYTIALEKRKKDSTLWQKSVYFSTPETESDIIRLAHERDLRLAELKTPRMNPSLNFQDQLNMENVLEQENLLIRHYIRSLGAITAGNFLLLVGLCLAMCLGHYSFLQTYVFQGLDSVAYYLIYAAAIAVFMLLCWMLPYNYFRKKLKGCIVRFQTAAETFINGYYEKARQFGNYINLLNQLDYITRYHRLLTRADQTTHRLSQGYLWHKVQIRNHLSKLQFFQGLIDLGTTSEEDPNCPLPDINGTQVSDYIDSQVYWP